MSSGKSVSSVSPEMGLLHGLHSFPCALRALKPRKPAATQDPPGSGLVICPSAGS